MKKLSSSEKEIIKFLNDRRDKAYVDIYLENDFSGLGILIDEELNVYEYSWKTVFNRQNNFSTVNELYQVERKMHYDSLEGYFLKDLNLVEKEYPSDSCDEYRSCEVIRLPNCVGEFDNSELYEIIKDELSNLLKEDL